MKSLYGVILLCMGAFCVHAQQYYKYYEVRDSADFQSLKLHIATLTGNCAIAGVDTREPLSIFGSEENNASTSSYKKVRIGDQLSMDIKLRGQDEAHSVFSAISESLFDEESETSEQWMVQLSNRYPTDLSLHYAIGNAEVNLSNLRLQKLKIKTGGADIHVFYEENKPNPIPMDSFLLKVDFGSLVVNRMNLSGAKVVDASVGFGNLRMDFSDKRTSPAVVTASVGAGTMEVILPENHASVLVYVNDSPLCGVHMMSCMKEIRPHVFASEDYKEGAPSSMVFHVDVGMGSIHFVHR